jgi:hypothetical protein
MGQTSDQIESEIERSREDLRANIEELEARVRNLTDWRKHFREHTGAMVVAAMVGGLLLSLLIGKR